MDSSKLVYWDDWASPNFKGADGVQTLLKKFSQEHPHIKLGYQCTYENGQETRKILTSMAAGVPPDVYLMDRFLVASFVARDGLTDLTGFVKESGVNKEDYFKAAWDEVVYKEKTWGIPFDIGSRMLFYRVDDFKEVGLDPDKPPRTWKDIEDYSDRLLKKDVNGRIIRVGFVPGIGNDFIYMYGWLNGGEFIREDRITCDEPRIVEALRWMKMFRDKYGIIAVGNFIQSLDRSPFIMGKVSMMINGDWEINEITKYAPNLDFRIAPPPFPEGREPISWVGGYAFVIPAKAKNKKAAWEFIRFMTSPENMKFFYEKSGMLPANKKAAMGLKLHNPKQQPFLDFIDKSKYRPVTPIARFYWDKMLQVQDIVLGGHGDAAQELSRAAREIQIEQDKYK